MAERKSELLLRLKSRRNSLFERPKCAEPMAFPAELNGGHPPLTRAPNSYSPAGVIPLPPFVHHVRLMRDVPKVRDPVIGRATVAVVDLSNWPAAVEHCPSNAPCRVTSPENVTDERSHLAIAKNSNVERWLSSEAAVKSRLFPLPPTATRSRKPLQFSRLPAKDSGARIIIKKLTEVRYA